MHRPSPLATRTSLLLAAAVMFGCALPAQAGVLHYTASLSGPAEAPPNASPGIGGAEITIDNVANTMRVQASFLGLLGNTQACHIHTATAVAGTGTAGVATLTPAFTGFPLGVTAGSMDHTFDLTLTSSYNGPFVSTTGGTAAGGGAAFLRGRS